METISAAATKFQAENRGTFEALPSWRAGRRSTKRTRRIERGTRLGRTLSRARVAIMRRGWGVWPRHRQYFNWLHAEAITETIFQLKARQRPGWAFRVSQKVSLWCLLIYCVQFAFVLWFSDIKPMGEKAEKAAARRAFPSLHSRRFGSVLICLFARVFLWKQN